MARRLPWATGADAIISAKGKRNTVQRGRQEDPISADEDLASKPEPHQMSSPMKSPSTMRVRKRETSRTPSTSPPPPAPPEELMHEGYHADDIFMMVEDEFQAVAQTFTHHLHHAEYVRMKKKARAGPTPAFSQPLNSVRVEIKKKFEINELRDRQNVAVKNIIRRAGHASPDNEEEVQGNDPWQGTSLAGLMAKDGTQSRMALVGLEQISSSTRAAKGFSRGEGDSPTEQRENRSVLEIYGNKRAGRTASLIIKSPTEEVKEDEDEDLGAPSRTKPKSKQRKPWPPETEEASDKNVLLDPGQPLDTLSGLSSLSDSWPDNGTKKKVNSSSLQPGSKLSSRSLHRKVDSFDDFIDENSDGFLTRPRSNFGTSSKTRPKGKSAKEKDNRSRLNEIPTFLV